MEILIDPQLKHIAPNLKLGIVQGAVAISQYEAALWQDINRCLERITKEMSIETLTRDPEIEALRETYRNLGKDPSRYRGSAEALLRRVLQGKGLYQVNSVVDINNLISLETRRSVGSYDLAKLKPPIVFRIGRPGETYKGIGKGIINIAELPLFADALGPFGSPTSDSERAMITTDTQKVMMVIISPTGASHLHEQLQRAVELLCTHAKAPRASIATMIA
jgi:DNA/RNA-binding domain of Phe-tRNA-synthetase-like protein